MKSHYNFENNVFGLNNWNYCSITSKVKTLIILFMILVAPLQATTITSTATGGAWTTPATWVGNAVPATTDAIVIATTGAGSVTSPATTMGSLTVNLGATLTCTTTQIAVNGAINNAGTITLTTGRLTQATTTTADFTNSGTITYSGSGRLYIAGSLINNGTLNLAGTQVRFVGSSTAASTASGFTTTGAITFSRSAGSVTFQGNVTGASVSETGAGTLNLGTGLTHTFSGNYSKTAGVLNGGSSILKIGGTFSNAGTFTPNLGTINLTGAAQSLVATTYYNLTLSGTGTKTFPTGTTTVTGVLSIENGTNANTFTGSIAYGASATLQYNAGSSARTVSTEWPSTFTANTCAGGVIIKGTGAITLNGAKTLNSGIPLNITSGAILTPGANLLTLGGDFTNAGTLTSGAGGLTFNGTTSTQTIGAFTTTGPVTIAGTVNQNLSAFSTTNTVSMTKTAGTATFVGNVSGAALTINGSGGTLNIGTSLTHTFSGDITLTTGSLNGETSTLNVNSSTISAWGGTGSLFTANLSTVVFGGTAQTISASSPTFYNLIFSGTSANKTIPNALTITNALTINSSAVALLANGTTSTTKDLYFGASAQIGGSWGGSSSSATNKTATYFGSSTTGILNASNLPRFIITGTATQTAGTTQNITITQTNSAGVTNSSYTGDKVLTFSGANSSISPVNAATIKDKTGTNVSFGNSTTITFTNGVATVSAGNNGVLTLYKAESAIISVTDGTITSTGSDRLSINAIPANISMSFSIEPNGGLYNAVWSSQPVITFKDSYGNSELASNPHTVALTILNNAGPGGTLSGTTSVAMNTFTSQATFSGLSIDKTGAGYTLQAATSGISSVNSTSFDISNPTPTLSGISPTYQCAGGSGFTLIVNGTNFSTNSVVKINGSSRTTTFINSTELSAVILSSDVLTAGTPAITVYSPSPGGGTTSSTNLTVTQVTIGSSIVQPSCSADGGISITASAGTAPYTYDWFDLSGTNNVQNRVGLKAGTYQITVTDANGCSATSSVFTLTAASNCTGISVCKSDAASVLSVTPDPKNTSYTWTVPTGATIVSGQGTPAITINWTAVTIGSYQVSVVSSNGCGSSSTSFIDVYVEKPTITAYAEPVCSGSALNLYAFGGTTYSWTGPSSFASQSANPVVLSPVAGRYYVRVTNEKGCSDTTSVLVTINSAPAMSNATVKNADCSSSTGSITLSSISGGSGFTFAWTGPNGFTSTSQNISGLLNGTFTVVVTNSTGCSTTQSFNVGLTTGPEVAFTTVTNETCKNGTTGAISITASGGTSTYSYEWTGPNGFTSSTLTTSSTTNTISSLLAGTYTVTLSDDALGCSTTASTTITEPAAIQADGVVTNINCYGSSSGSVVQTVSGGTPTYTYAWTGPNSFTATTKDISSRPAGTYNVTITDHAGSGSCTLAKSYSITQPSAAISITPTITNAKCYGDSNGQITLAVIGGTSPYTYAWTGPNSYTHATPNIEGLAAGSYSVTVSDSKGCSSSLSGLVVSQPSAALSTTGSSQSNITIYGNSNGSITLPSSLGGTLPYTYAWSNGAVTKDLTGLVAGTYSVLITDTNGCSTTASFTITTATQLTASATPTAATCNNSSTGALTLSVSGGTSPYTYLWSNSATTQNLNSVAAGFYSVTVTDHNGATVGASTIVINPTAIVINGSVTNVLCNGSSTGAITLSVSGGTGSYNYDWTDVAGTNNSQNRTNLAAGTYSATVTDANGCSSSKSFTITQTTALSLSSTHNNILCRGDNTGSISLSVSGGQLPYTFLWTNSATTQNISGLTAGNYSVEVTDTNGCIVNSSTITISQPSSSLSSSISHSNVSCKGGNNGSITLTPSGGTASYSYAWSNGATSQSLSDLVAGNYSVTITDANGCTTSNSAIITEPSTEIILYATSKNASGCGGATGSITLTVENGTATPLTYAWTGPNGYTHSTQNISSLSAGNYSITVTDHNGCSSALPVTVGSASSLNVSVTTYDKSCPNNDGAAYAVVTGGVEPYTYLWTGGLTTNNITGLGTGNYSVSVTDANGCTASNNGNVSSPACAPPVAAVYNFTTGNTTQLAKSVATSKVTDADNTLSQLSFIGLTIPTPDQGTLDWDPSNGGFVYTPNPSFYGNVSVNYQVVDPTNLTSTSQLNITVKQEVQTYNILATPSFTAAKLKWKNGSRASRAVFMSETGGAISDPVYGTTYTASANWNTKGTQLSNSAYYCIYNGADTTVYLTHLYPGTQYTVQAYEYDGTVGSQDYLTNLGGANNPKTFTPWPTTTFTNSAGVSSMETWNTAVRWDHDTIPTANLHTAVLVYIDGNCEVTSAAESNNLTVKSTHNGINPKITIDASKSLNIAGAFTNNGSTSSVLVKTSSTLPGGTLTWVTGTINGSVEMYSPASWDLTNEVNNRYRWQFFGIPIAQTTAGNTFNFNQCYVRKWEESVTGYYNVWVQKNDGTTLYQNSGSTLYAGLGYELVQQNPATYTFSGQLYHSDFNMTLPYTSSAAFPGQSVLGNPYTAAIDISTINFGANTEQAVYQYTTGTYKEWVDNSGQNSPGLKRGQHMASSKNTAGKNSVPAQIPSMQGFIVKSIGAAGSISIPYITALKTDTALQRSKRSVESTFQTSNVSTRIDLISDNFT
ncbi:MAG: cadherin-like domain-containing protein, partial [Paludibacter sp.]